MRTRASTCIRIKKHTMSQPSNVSVSLCWFKFIFAHAYIHITSHAYIFRVTIAKENIALIIMKTIVRKHNPPTGVIISDRKVSNKSD